MKTLLQVFFVRDMSKAPAHLLLFHFMISRSFVKAEVVITTKISTLPYDYCLYGATPRMCIYRFLLLEIVITNVSRLIQIIKFICFYLYNLKNESLEKKTIKAAENECKLSPLYSWTFRTSILMY